MNCDEILAIMARGDRCEQTEYGARMVTHCFYPSFDPVSVYVSKWGDGYRVTDGGGAVKSALLHGRDDTALTAALKKARLKFDVDSAEGMLVAEVDEAWLRAAVLAVANASAMVAEILVEHVTHAAENTLKSQMLEELRKVVPERHIARDYHHVGTSGNVWPIDLAVTAPRLVLLKAIAPHRNSVTSNYVVFGDAGSKEVIRYSVFERDLKPADAALMRQVAQLVPILALGPGTLRELNRPSLH